MRIKKYIPILFGLLPLASCQKAEEEYTTHQCYFSFNCTYHNASRLINAVSSYETFAIVTTEPLSGKTYTVVTSIYGTDDTRDNITTAEETQRSRVLGLANGLIIGRSAIDQTLYAYDRQCPNCFEATGFTAAPLQWSGNTTTVVCTRCDRKYNLSNGGVVSEGTAGKKLLRYRISYDGSYINVQNR